MKQITPNQVINSDALEYAQSLPGESIHCIVTSPPYFNLRNYGVEGQIGQEETVNAYVGGLVALFSELRRALRNDGTLWLNLGDSYAGGGGISQPQLDHSGNKRLTTRGHQPYSGAMKNVVKPSAKTIGLKPKNLMGIPWRVAFALQDDGWILRSDIIWHKPNSMPESVTDRPTKAHEYVFLFAKSEQYFYDADAIKIPAVRPGDVQTFGGNKGRAYHPAPNDPNFRNGSEQWGRTIQSGLNGVNKRSVWSIPTRPFKEAHFAVFPEKLIEPMILAGCPNGGIICDPFMGSGTTALVARRLNRQFTGSELNPEYVAMANKRLSHKYTPDMFEVFDETLA